MMPQKVICKDCGEILYSDIDLKPPEELIRNFEGKCPKCGKELSYNPENIEIRELYE
ncbi:MAG: hypothetical protein JSV20_08965 [Candidatus Bathyarchaeota archaeon]|nr:MAG: hypothetical protein JSV20_08965 [Candidatus Bathyarchaeota archaeon]